MPSFEAGSMSRRLLQREPVGIRKVNGGRNAEVWRVDTATGAYALKRYVRSDAQERMSREIAALRFLERHRVPNVPRLVNVDTKSRVVLQTWLMGVPIVHPTERDVLACADFIARLRVLTTETDAAQLPAAKEACESISTILDQIEGRIARLTVAAENDSALMGFIDDEIIPRRIALDHLRQELPEKFPIISRTLSPADFGAHNAVRSPDGELGFFDFEYFGWDDAVKLTADFLLHPGMMLPERHRRQFAARMCALFGSEEGFARRLAALVPAYRLRWALIMMNPVLDAVRMTINEKRNVESIARALVTRAGMYLAAMDAPAIWEDELHGAA